MTLKNVEEKISMLHDKLQYSPETIHCSLDDRVAGLSGDAALVVLVSSHLHVSIFTPGWTPAGRKYHDLSAFSEQTIQGHPVRILIQNSSICGKCEREISHIDGGGWKDV